MDFNRSSEIPQHLPNPNDPNSQIYNAQQTSSCYAQYPYYAHHPLPPPHQPQNPNPNPNPNTVPIINPNTVPIITYDTNSYASSSSLQPSYGDPYAAISSYNAAHVGGGGGYEAQVPIAYSQHPQVEVLPGGQQSYYQDPAILQYGAANAGYAAAIKSPKDTIVPTIPTQIVLNNDGDISNDAMIKTPKDKNNVKSLQCEICKIECNNVDALDRHKVGKKHKRNLLKQEKLSNGSNTPAISNINDATNSTPQKTTITSLRCEVCKIECNIKDALDRHIVGKKHKKNLVKQELSKGSTTPAIFNWNDAMNRIPEMKKRVDSLRCEVCKIDCNKESALIQHKVGNKHKKNLVKQGELSKCSRTPAISKIPSIGYILKATKKRGLPGEDLETKKQKVTEAGAASESVMVCTICKVVCNSQLVFDFHLAGKKHISQAVLRAPSSSAGQMIPPNPNPAFTTRTAALRPTKRPMKKGPKKTKIVQSAWCHICNIDCTTKEVLDIHKSGKKHQKNLQKKLEGSNIKPAATTTTASSTAPVIGPQENPSKDPQTMKKPSSVPDEDVEMKRKKLMEGGAAADSVRVCKICNIAVNSQTVFAYHLAGQKHAAMVKKQAGGTADVPAGVVTAA